MTTSERIPLPVPTNATLKGPRLTHEQSTLAVAYDYERSNGTTVWAELVFDEVLALEYRDSACCEPDQVVGSSHLVRYSDSAWLGRIRGLWSAAVGWQEYEQSKGGADRFGHFRLYFDDAACIEVIAAALSINETNSEQDAAQSLETRRP
jgi:hypothetical protein